LGAAVSRRHFLRAAAAGASGLLIPLEAFADDQVPTPIAVIPA
jgi:hypothetical protein